MAERLKAAVSKTVMRLCVASRVRIPLSPPSVFANFVSAKFSYDAIVLWFIRIEDYRCVGACKTACCAEAKVLQRRRAISYRDILQTLAITCS